jgi:hypothetical protein
VAAAASGAGAWANTDEAGDVATSAAASAMLNVVERGPLWSFIAKVRVI